ncbi:MAG: MTH938/NDUFAF3 family protein [bacterium]
MNVKIDATSFGSITINGDSYDYDVLIRSSGKVKKRKKKLSKRVYGSSHTMSQDEAEHVYEERLETLIVGTGQQGILRLSPEAEEFFQEKNIHVILRPTPEAIKVFNKQSGRTAGLFHITC